MEIPFVDLKTQYLSLKNEIDGAIQKVINETSFIGGDQIKQFEKQFASYIGIEHCIACGNGTDSLEILLLALGVKPGDEVIVPALSWISTSESVSSIGASPVFVDIDEHFTINPDKIKEKLTSRTKAIIPVHLYGHPANMPVIMKIAKEHQLKVIEDCAQSHGAMIQKRITGTWGDAASFSFYPGKNLGAYGDAGAMMTNDPELATKCRQMANHGQRKKHDHVIEGRNSRMDTLQAAILNVKLPYLNKWTEARKANAAKYNETLHNSKVVTPSVMTGATHVYHLYVIRTKKRNELQEFLTGKGIQTAIHYPTALPFLPCYKQNNFQPSDFPLSYQYQDEILSIPMFAELSMEQIEYVSGHIKDFAKIN